MTKKQNKKYKTKERKPNEQQNNSVQENHEKQENKVASEIEKTIPIQQNIPVAHETKEEEEKDATSKDYYFDSYSHFGIHEEMLKDSIRTRAYMNAIIQNSHLFRDKVVLDVGCGTAILSMFAAKAGARLVIGVDCSKIIQQAREIVNQNGFGDRIVLIKGKMEEIQLPVEKVDIIISEWMGYFLLYESMLPTVLYARDRYLVPNGLIFPDKASLFLAAIEDEDYRRKKIDFWDNVYGFDMSTIKHIALAEPLVDVVEQSAVISDSVKILDLDLLTCTNEDLSFVSSFSLKFKRNDYCHALIAYFDCHFTQIHRPLKLSTSPFKEYTHWKQTVFYLNEHIIVNQNEVLLGEIRVTPNRVNPRDLDIVIKYDFDGAYKTYHATQNYFLR